MIVRINSPVLVPFGYNPLAIEFLCGLDKDVYIAPQYRFLWKKMELALNNLPTQSTLDYIHQKYKDDFTGIVKHSKYYGIMKFLFNEITAESMDKLYQIDFDEHQKLVLGLYLSQLLEQSMDDKGKIKRPIIDKNALDYGLSNMRSFFHYFNIKNLSVKMVTADLASYQFASIYDIIYRKSRLYTPQYLGFISLFTGEKERIQEWDFRLKHVINNNLLQGGHVILTFPSEYEEKINRIMKDNNLNKLGRNIWQKPDIKVKKLNKNIKRYY